MQIEQHNHGYKAADRRDRKDKDTGTTTDTQTEHPHKPEDRHADTHTVR